MSVVASHYLKVTTQQYACYKPQLLALVVARRSKQGTNFQRNIAELVCVCVSWAFVVQGWLAASQVVSVCNESHNQNA